MLLSTAGPDASSGSGGSSGAVTRSLPHVRGTVAAGSSVLGAVAS